MFNARIAGRYLKNKMGKTQARKLILIDGGPASGKNALGNLLAKNFNTSPLYAGAKSRVK